MITRNNENTIIQKIKTMNIFKLSFAGLLLASIAFTSCGKESNCKSGSGGIETKTLNIAAFTSIDFQEAGEVIISEGPVQEVVVTGHSNAVNDIQSTVNNGLWEIDFDSRCYKNYDLTVYITMPKIEGAYLSGSGSITLNDFVTPQNDLSLIISGSGNIFLSAFEGSEQLFVNISGSGDITTSADIPTLKSLDINISGSGNYKGYSTITDACTASISGSGNCEVYVQDSLDVSISGSGSVFYKGNPTVNANISGSGTVVNAN